MYVYSSSITSKVKKGALRKIIMKCEKSSDVIAQVPVVALKGMIASTSVIGGGFE